MKIPNPTYVIFRNDTWDNCKNSDIILEENEILLISNEGKEFAVIGDGKSKITELQVLEKLPQALQITHKGTRSIIKAITRDEVKR